MTFGDKQRAQMAEQHALGVRNYYRLEVERKRSELLEKELALIDAEEQYAAAKALSEAATTPRALAG